MAKGTRWILLVVVAFGLLASHRGGAETADGFFREGRFLEAAQAYRSQLRVSPHNIAARLGLVRTLLRLDGVHWQEAIQEAATAVRLAPKDADAHGLYALALFRGGRVEEARAETERSLQCDPKDYYGLVAQGKLYLWNNENKKATEVLQQAIELYPQRDTAYAYWLMALPDEDYNQALLKKYLKAYLSLHPMGHPHDAILHWLAHTRMNEKQPAKPAVAWEGMSKDRVKAAEDGSGPPITYTIPVEWQDGLMVLPVKINGQSFKLLFDTGASDVIALTHSAIERLGLPAEGQTVARGVRGEEETDVYRARSVQLGPQEIQDDDISSIGNNAAPEDGIFGGANLKHCVVTIDFQENTCTVTEGKNATAPPPLEGDMTTSVPFHLFQGYIFLPVLLGDRTRVEWAMLDTGAAPLGILSLITARELARKENVDSYKEVDLPLPLGVGSKNGTFRALLFAFSIDLTLAHPQGIPFLMELDPILGASIMEDLSQDFDFQLSALVGMPFLAHARRVTIDYPHQILTLELANQ